MAAVVAPSDEEAYLLAILEGADGLDLAEFSWYDSEREDGCYRAWDYQWSWYTCTDTYQIDQGARSTGKTVSMKMRAFAFPFNKPGQKMLVTAPELNHLRPVVDAIEQSLLTTRLGREMLPETKGQGINRQPHWQVRFKNGSQIVSRLPNRDGKGVKSQHVIQIELDEAQDYPLAGWIEIVECLNRGLPGAMWRCIAAGQLVLTKRGWIAIEAVAVGDEVWTHKARWRPVLRVFDNGVRECVSVSGQGHFGVELTPDHKIWSGVNRRRKIGGVTTRQLEEMAFAAVDVVAQQGGRWASPTSVAQDAPVPPMTRAPRSRHHQSISTQDPRWLWLYGLYLAEGYSSSYPIAAGGTVRRVHWCVSDQEAEEVHERVTAVGLTAHRYQQGRSVKIVVNGQQIHDWLLAHAGNGELNKAMAPWVFGLDEAGRRQVLDGALYGDKSWSTARKRHEYGTSSRRLALDIKLLAQSLGCTANIALKPAHLSVIAGRTVLTADHYVVQITPLRPGGQTLMRTEMAWGLLKPADVQPIGLRSVYDLEVHEDHSFVVEGIVVSNCHGVSKGVRDRFFEYTEEGSGWTVHRPVAMNRPTWTKEERDEKVLTYGGSRQNIDYKRNIYGEHGDASNSVFVLSRLMATVDTDDGSVYNSEVYSKIVMEYERLPDTTGMTEEEADYARRALLGSMLDIPGSHLAGYSQTVDRRQVGAPQGYTAFWGGADIGVTNHPSEFLIAGQKAGEDSLELLLRVNLQRINTDDQKWVIEQLFEFYGSRLKAFSLDKTGVGFPIWDQLSRHPRIGKRIYGYNFSEKVVVGFDDRELEGKETQEDLAIWRNVVEATTDWLRNDYVDGKRLRLPYDREVLLELQGQTYVVIKDSGNPYGTRRIFAGGSFHTLDALKMLVAGKHLPQMAETLKRTEIAPPILDIFFEA